MKSILAIFLLLLSVSIKANAQTVSHENHIIVIGQATIDIPADQVEFNVVLKTTDSASVDKVYEKHQTLENNLVQLLKDLQVSPKNISYSLFSVGKRRDYDTKEWYYAGSQTVNFTIDSVSQFSAVQSKLIKAGFTEFSSSFASTAMEQQKTEVMAKAVEVAKEKAQVLAKAADRKIKRIVKVADTEDTDPILRNYGSYTYPEMKSTSVGYGDSKLTVFPQTIPLSASVKVVFELK